MQIKYHVNNQCPYVPSVTDDEWREAKRLHTPTEIGQDIMA